MRNTERSRLRRRAGLTQHQLARLVGKSAAAICLWESGQIDFSQEDVKKIANALEKEFTKQPPVSGAAQIAVALAGASA